MEWLTPAVAFMALSSTVLAATFFYVWLTAIRRRYVLLWSLAWLAAIVHLVLTLTALHGMTTPATWTLQQLALVLNASLMVGGCFEFVHRRLPILLLTMLALPFAAWAIVAPILLTDRFLHMTLPSSVLLAGSYLWTSSRFFVLERARATRGARLVAILFAVAGLHELDYPLLGNRPWAMPFGYTLQAMLTIAIAVSLLVMILEESRSEAEGERARMRAILDNLPVGVLVTSPDGRVLLANGSARALVGTPLERRSALAETEAAAFRRPDGSACPPEELPISQALLTGQATPSREFTLMTPDGSAHAVVVNAGPVRDEKDALIGAVAVFQDIGPMKTLQAEMARSEKLQGLGTLAAGVAHDFNNALTTIVGHAELAMEEAETPSVRKSLEVICKVATDSAAIVRRIQDVARSRTARASTVFDVADVVREVVEFARPRWRDEAQARGLQFEVTTDLPRRVLVEGHPEEIREALINLFFNALDAMPRGGYIALSAHAEGEAVVVRVEDGGIGMPPEVRDRIFDPFFTTKGQRGTGLGLAVVYGIVQRHGGTIGVVSHPGQGTTFTLKFPARHEATLDEAARAEAAPAVRRRVLVVDDEPLVGGVVAALLQSAGHDVQRVVSGRQALEQFALSDFDVVLTDLGMPEMNGWEVALGLHRLRRSAAVVLMTGWGEMVSPEDAERHGIAAILPKPFTRSQLVEQVEAALRGSRVGME